MGSRRTCAVVAAAVLAAWPAQAETAAGVVGRSRAAPPAVHTSTDSHREMSAIVHAWSTRLNAGDYAGIARLFTLPAYIVQGQYAYRLATRDEVALWHSGLPCAGTVISIAYRGDLATAVFRLGTRRGRTCDQPGGVAAAQFEIVNGKIHSWIQVPVPASGTSGPIA